ncbi:MAG: helix-hairpin-helix domain-containing protein [Betaproteobacteria bacterium]|nr:helix-hairpin-helix domain-containing protein [Betaproteobacteria bacterium]
MLISTPLYALDLNRATQSELETLKGVGPVKARAIVEYRQRHGPFRRVEDLARVDGFSRRAAQLLKSDLTLATEKKPLHPGQHNPDKSTGR